LKGLILDILDFGFIWAVLSEIVLNLIDWLQLLLHNVVGCLQQALFQRHLLATEDRSQDDELFDILLDLILEVLIKRCPSCR